MKLWQWLYLTGVTAYVVTALGLMGLIEVRYPVPVAAVVFTLVVGAVLRGDTYVGQHRVSLPS